ncbi:hypothetical protein NC652_015140 [Populus alba x Populus x berolinensis]|nr:hypothetical protein NC652_015140 [Populus alba x Populus x berolinensis]
MKEDDDKVDQLENCNAFLADILVWFSYLLTGPGGEVLAASIDKDSPSSDEAERRPEGERRRSGGEEHTTMRRKILMILSPRIGEGIMEGKCRRLYRLLQCFIAENHALRLSLQRGNAFGGTSAKQKSAVLLLGIFPSPYWLIGLFPLSVRHSRNVGIHVLIPAVWWVPALAPGHHVPIHPNLPMPQSTLVEFLLETMEKKAP